MRTPGSFQAEQIEEGLMEPGNQTSEEIERNEEQLENEKIGWSGLCPNQNHSKKNMSSSSCGTGARMLMWPSGQGREEDESQGDGSPSNMNFHSCCEDEMGKK